MLTRLFPEILSYIMILAQESALRDIDSDEDYVLGDDFPHRIPLEITISHVNSSIRSTALHTARLWSSIRIDTGTQYAGVILDRTATYLERSMGHLLDLRIEVNDVALLNSDLPAWAWSVGDPTSNRKLRSAMGQMVEESMRWKKLTIVAEHQGISDFCGGILQRLIVGEGGCLTPELEYLSISVDYSETNLPWFGGVDDDNFYVTSTDAPQLNGRQHIHRSISPTSIIQKADLHQHPKLSFLRLRGLAIYLFRPTLLSSLRILHLDQTKFLPLSFDFFASIVTACPALEHLSVYGDIVMPSTSGTEVQAVIPVLGGGQVHPQLYQTGYAEIPGARSRSKPGRGCDMSICLSELRSLRLCGITGSVYAIVLSLLEAPKLVSLSLKDVQEHDLDALWEGPIANSTSGGARTGFGGGESKLSPRLAFTGLRSLIINSSDFSKTLYQRLFQVFPSITEFASYSSMEVDMAPDVLAGGAVAVPWPQLHTLTFVFDFDLDVDDEMLEELLRLRREYGYPVGKVRIGVADMDVGDETGSERQGAVIMMESLDEIDAWPLDRQYLDIDDVLF